MKLVRSMSLRVKTIMIAMVTSALALTISGVFFSLYDYQNAHQKADQEYKVIATILADRSTVALEFLDKVSAADNLSSLDAHKAITLACLYDAGDTLFASFHRNSYNPTRCPDSLPSNINQHGEAYKEIREPVVFDDTVIGTLYILADLGDLRESMFLHIATSIIIVGITLFITFLLAVRLQAFVTVPIKKLQ